MLPALRHASANPSLWRRVATAREESFFVRCDDELNPPANQGLGQLVALVGVAPAEPLEYLVLRITQDAEGHVEVVAEDG